MRSCTAVDCIDGRMQRPGIDYAEAAFETREMDLGP